MAWPLDRYADLVVQVGVNVQPKQHVFINALVEHRPLVRELVRSAYEAGAAYVDVRYQDPHVRRAFIQLAPEETLTDTPGWILERSEAIADGGAVISLTGDDEPELLADLDLLRVGKARPIAADQVRQRGQMERTLSWTIVGCATPGWAEQIFGEPDLERTSRIRPLPGRNMSPPSELAATC
jgi:aminopeptidase